jgi:hypothetical protein
VAYFKYLQDVLGGRGVVIKAIRGGTSRVAIVELAHLYLKGDSNRHIDPVEPGDEVWAVFDWDQREDVAAAMRLAEQSVRKRGRTTQHVNVALSNPSFEVWLAWHFADYMAIGCVQDDADKQVKRYWPTYVKGKSTDFSALPPHRTCAAIDRAVQAARKHEVEGRSFPEDRPSSQVGALLERIVCVWKEQQDPQHPDGQCPLI